VLDAHPEIHCSGEGHFIERFTAPMAAVVREYNKHLSLVAGRVYEGQPYYQPIDQEVFDRLSRAFIMERLTSRNPGPEVQWVGDKTPRYAATLPQLNRLFPEARFINIVRDPRDAAVSRRFHANRAGIKEALSPDWAGREQLTRNAATDWVQNVQPIAPFAAAHAGRMHGLRYEDMLVDPAGEAVRVFGFLGVSTDPKVIDDVVRTTSFEAQSGRKAGDEDPNAFLRKGVAGDWVNALDAEMVKLVEDTCGDLMREYGYLEPAAAPPPSRSVSQRHEQRRRSDPDRPHSDRGASAG
jgi:hypothetical protein